MQVGRQVADSECREFMVCVRACARYVVCVCVCSGGFYASGCGEAFRSSRRPEPHPHSRTNPSPLYENITRFLPCQVTVVDAFLAVTDRRS